MKPRILVSGANGFVGSAILARLAAADADAVGLVRATSDLRRLVSLEQAIDRPLQTLLRTGDLKDAESLRSALHDRNVVIHCAAHASDWGAREFFYEANAAAVERLIENMTAEPGSRLVLISTANVAGYGRRGLTERDVPRRLKFDYSASKREGELIAQSLCRDREIALTILRPGAIYGPHDWSFCYRMASLIEAGSWPMISNGRARFTPVFIENLCNAIELAIEADGTGTFNITDGVSVSWREFSELFAKSLGQDSLRARSVPFSLAYPVAVISEAVFRLFRSERPPMATKYRVIRGGTDFDYDCGLAVERLGYRPDTDISAHVAETVRWYRSVQHNAPQSAP